MIVRDLTLPKSEYKGHPTHAVSVECPCRPCFNAHDCTPPDRRYGKQIHSDVFHCATNWNKGCPEPKPEPEHLLNRQGHCKRCGAFVKTGRGV